MHPQENLSHLPKAMPSLSIEQNWQIPEKDLKFHYARSGGPGGQHVNKVATKAELRFDLAGTTALSDAQKARLRRAFPAHITEAGELLLTSEKYRSRRRNEEDALERLAQMLRSIRRPPKPRIPTKVTLAQKRRRIEQKRLRGAQKRLRAGDRFD